MSNPIVIKTEEEVFWNPDPEPDFYESAKKQVEDRNGRIEWSVKGEDSQTGFYSIAADDVVFVGSPDLLPEGTSFGFG